MISKARITIGDQQIMASLEWFPDAPTGVVATVSNDGANVSWDLPPANQNVDGWLIQHRADPSAEWSGATLVTVRPFEVAGLHAGDYVRVAAYATIGPSEYGEPVQVS